MQINQKLTYEEKPIAFIDQQVWKLHLKEVPYVKIIQEKQGQEDATWESEESMKKSILNFSVRYFYDFCYFNTGC